MAKFVTFRCHTCGYASPNGDFYRRETGGLLGRRIRVCAGCTPYRSDRSDQRTMASMAIWIAVYGLFAFRYASDFGTTAQGLAWFLAAAFSAPFNIAAHELGHAVAARLVGSEVLKVRLGLGPRRFSIRVAGVAVEGRRYPFLGGEIVHLPPSATFPAWKSALIALAGPATNLALAVVFATLASFLPSDPGLIWAAAFSGLTLANLFLGVTNLFVWRRGGSAGAQATRSDGAIILDAFRRRAAPPREVVEQFAAERLTVLGRYDEAASAYEALLSLRPADTFYLCKTLHLIDRARGPAAALAAYQRLVLQGPPQRRPWDLAPMESFLHGNLAWFLLKLGDADSLARADIHAPLAMAHAGISAEIQATMGALDVRRGRLEEGERLLLQGVRSWTIEPMDRSDFCAFLAYARRAGNDEPMAAEYEALGRYALRQA